MVGLGSLDPIASPKLVSKCLFGWMSSVGQTEDQSMIIWDDESRSLWVMALTTCSPNQTNKHVFLHLWMENMDCVMHSILIGKMYAS